jgi:DNA repair protein RadD
VESLREGIRAGHRKQVLMSPTGSGKTEIACHMLQEAGRKRFEGIVHR